MSGSVLTALSHLRGELMELVTLEEMKNYLRVDYEEDDLLLQAMIDSAMSICMAVARCDDVERFSEDKNSRIAVMYAVAYLYEHREEADHHRLTLSLRSLLFGIRKEEF